MSGESPANESLSSLRTAASAKGGLSVEYVRSLKKYGALPGLIAAATSRIKPETVPVTRDGWMPDVLSDRPARDFDRDILSEYKGRLLSGLILTAFVAVAILTILYFVTDGLPIDIEITENFWSIIWVVVWSFFFVAYLFVLFYVLTDLFRDRQLSGWWKALWIVLLIFMPYLTALVYIIARGRGMAERQQSAYREARSAQDTYIKQVAGSGGGSSAAQHIADAKALLDNGTISEAEFQQLKSAEVGRTH